MKCMVYALLFKYDRNSHGAVILHVINEDIIATIINTTPAKKFERIFLESNIHKKKMAVPVTKEL